MEMPEIGEVRRSREIGKKGFDPYIWIACIICGKERWVCLRGSKPRNLNCHSCANRLNQLGKIPLLETRQKMSKSRFREKNPNWQGGKVKRFCLHCGNVFEAYPSEFKIGKGKFCSQSCSIIYARKQGCYNSKPTKPESLLIELLREGNLPFRYVGNGEIWLGNRNPDFINVNGKKQVIEIFGTYWHPLFDGAQRIEHYKQYGFSSLIIWQDELKNLDKVTKKIAKFSREG